MINSVPRIYSPCPNISGYKPGRKCRRIDRATHKRQKVSNTHRLDCIIRHLLACTLLQLSLQCVDLLVQLLAVR